MENHARDLPSSAALAYLGDAVHSLYVRRAVVAGKLSHAGDLHEAGLRYVTAAAQSEAMKRILPLLTEEEQDVARRAHNSHHLRKPKHMSLSDYRRATSLEAVLGMLAYTGRTERLEFLMAEVLSVPPQEEGGEDNG